jgi:hypothetical protein
MTQAIMDLNSKTLLVRLSALATALAATFAHAQTAPAAPASSAGHQHHEGMQMDKSADSSATDHKAMGHDMSGMKSMPAGDHAMQSALGPYPMTREGSGTSWLPDATPMMGLHITPGEWSVMAHGFVNAIYDKQTGPRGDEKAFTQSMAMLMGNRPVGPGTLGLRAMVSLDPTMGKSGYPLLFQTGESADGTTPLVDRQHPHDFFMELSASYSLRLGADSAAFAYFGLPGEPALGPSAFMHRFSGMRNPEAPLTHHWLDSTHITFGVATLGVSKGPVQLEASWFNGREPDSARWNIETRKFDSWSTRLSYNPVPEVSMQVSYGDLKSPEQLEPDTRLKRTTASVTYQLNTGAGEWGTTLAYGRNKKSGAGHNVSEPGWLLESTYVLQNTHVFFARAEQVKNSELFLEGHPLHGQEFNVRKLSVGYIYEFAKTGPVKWGIGGLMGFLKAPSQVDPYYGSSPRSYMVFVQGWL